MKHGENESGPGRLCRAQGDHRETGGGFEWLPGPPMEVTQGSGSNSMSASLYNYVQLYNQ